ncbi:hypothetical protein ACFWIJ_05130 [Streptomyces sp. NPDC127079]|uniref:hypothetical protein n=1 Tax=Streptomyces sp. NPDC127079 TaxID=3347132 RepID=UPI0036538538
MLSRAGSDCDRAASVTLSAARVAARAIVWLQADDDATPVACRSELELAAPTCKHAVGYHPLLCFLDSTREALAGLLHPGNAVANTAEDHITVLDAASGPATAGHLNLGTVPARPARRASAQP